MATKLIALIDNGDGTSNYVEVDKATGALGTPQLLDASATVQYAWSGKADGDIYTSVFDTGVLRRYVGFGNILTLSTVEDPLNVASFRAGKYVIYTLDGNAPNKGIFIHNAATGNKLHSFEPRAVGTDFSWVRAARFHEGYIYEGGGKNSTGTNNLSKTTTDGVEQWAVRAGGDGAVVNFLEVADGAVYCYIRGGTIGAGIEKRSLVDGSLIWQYQSPNGDQITTSFVVTPAGESYYAIRAGNSFPNRMYKVDAAGGEAWSNDITDIANYELGAALDENDIYFFADGDTLRRIDPATGTRTWSTTIAGMVNVVVMPEFEGVITATDFITAPNEIDYLERVVDFSSAFKAEDSYTAERAFAFYSKLAAGDALDSTIEAHANFKSSLGSIDSSTVAYILELASALGLSGLSDIEHAKILAFATSVLMDSAFEERSELAINLASALALSSALEYGVIIEEMSTLEASTLFESRLSLVNELISTMGLEGSESTSLEAQMSFVSAMDLGTDSQLTAELTAEFKSRLAGLTFLQLGENVYVGWALNSRTGGFAEYENYPFLELASYKEQAFGVSEDGVYLLEGDTDDGDPIEALIRTRLTTFGSSNLKDVKAAYVGYTSSGQMVLKATVVDQGVKHEYWYKLKHGGAGSIQTGRATIQRGLKSSHWQFEICNVDGADFDIDDVTLMYNILPRRIR